MNIAENIREGIKSIQANKLRTILTAAIIAIGISALVGMLTTIDGIQASINNSFSNLGANAFDIRNVRNRGQRQGKKQKVYPPLKYDEVVMFRDKYTGAGTPSLSTFVSFTAEAKRQSKVSNPNLAVKGGDENFLAVEGADLKEGRNFSFEEARSGNNVVIIGNEVFNSLFEKGEDPINQTISFMGSKFRVVGLIDNQGSVSGDGGTDRLLLVPFETARRISGQRSLRYDISVGIPDPVQMEKAMGIATGLMRRIRQDQVGQPNSFEIRQSKSLAETLGEITGYLQIGGITIGMITLVGASIGLMNIMLVSVTERTREIGVRKALGATPMKIRQQFLVEALVICQLGGIGGIILGIIFGNLVANLIDAGTFVIPWAWILFGVVVGMVVGLLSGYIPAYKASKLDPIESLRFE